jgi:hypothetical protein
VEVNILIDRIEMILWFIVAILLGMFLAFIVDYYSDFDVQLQVYASQVKNQNVMSGYYRGCRVFLT